MLVANKLQNPSVIEIEDDRDGKIESKTLNSDTPSLHLCTKIVQKTVIKHFIVILNLFYIIIRLVFFLKTLTIYII